MPMSLIEVLKYRTSKHGVQVALDAKAPKAGDIAIDFELRDNQGENPLQLSGFIGVKPVALVFGSYT